MKRFVVAAVGILASGCASVVHQTTQQIPVKSDPPGASVTVACGDVANDAKLTTPTVITVHRKPDYCLIKLAKEGYKAAEFSLTRTMSGWYMGNILAGGIVGFIVDYANGAMWNRSPISVDVKMEQENRQ